MNKKLLSLVITAGLLLVGGVKAQAEPGDAYSGEYSKVDPATQILAEISDKAGNDWTGLMKQIPLEQQGPSHEGWVNCESLTSKTCDFRKDGGTYQGNAVLQACTLTTSDFCVSGLDLASPGGDFQPAQFVRESKQTVWTADRSANFPGGGGVALFTAPNAPTAGGYDSYAVAVTLKFSWNPGDTKFDIHEMFASVYPYRGYAHPGIRGIAGWGGNQGEVCSWSEPGFCGAPQDWVLGTKARLKFTMPSTIAGWFKGRIQDPTVSITSTAPGVNQITVAASPVDVPQLALVKPKAEKEALLASGMDLGWWGSAGYEAVGLQSNGRSVAQFIERYRKELGDASTGSTTMWNFSTIQGGHGSNCLVSNDKVLGIVTTNAMGYDGNAPSFDGGMLTYHVSGMHYKIDHSTLTEGTYDLVMQSDVARCLYGFTNAPISATVSVIDDAGQTKTAVTTVSEKNGWLKMAAYGFSFSNPTLNVKITQGSPEVSEPETTPVVTKSPSAKPTATESPAPAKTTITCVKGKLTKKFTAVSPKCPAGYKKKG